MFCRARWACHARWGATLLKSVRLAAAFARASGRLPCFKGSSCGCSCSGCKCWQCQLFACIGVCRVNSCSHTHTHNSPSSADDCQAAKMLTNITFWRYMLSLIAIATLGTGSTHVAPGRHHGSGAQFSWQFEGPWEMSRMVVRGIAW